MSESKTAKASKVVEKFEKKVIPDAELIRLLRIDRASGLYPTTQGADALLRTFDAEHERLGETEAEVIGLKDEIRDHAGDIKEVRDRAIKLVEAVRSLYYAAVWSADRPVDEAKLWEDVRDAAGFEPGNSPKPMPKSVDDEISTEEFETRIAWLETELEETKSTLRVAEIELENIKTGN